MTWKDTQGLGGWGQHPERPTPGGGCRRGAELRPSLLVPVDLGWRGWGNHDKLSVLPGGLALSLAGRQNKLRALVSQAPPGRQHGQARLAGEMCPQQHLGPWPLASARERLSLSCLFSEQHTGVQDPLATEDRGQCHGLRFFCAHRRGKQKPPGRSEPRLVDGSCWRRWGGGGQPTTTCVSISQSALTKMISFGFCLSRSWRL